MHARDVTGERLELVVRDARSLEVLHRGLDVHHERGMLSVPSIRRGPFDATGEHRRLTLAGRGRPDEGVVAAVDMAARAGAAVLRDARVSAAMEELAAFGDEVGEWCAARESDLFAASGLRLERQDAHLS